jgi:dimethylargininase
VILRPGAPTRRGEAAAMAKNCELLGLEVHRLAGAGTVDGGDILVTDREILVGESDRTDRAGFEALEHIVGNWGYTARRVQTPAGVLHFKSDCSILDSDTVLATHRLSGADCFGDYRVIETPPGEEAAANSIRVNDAVLVPAGYPATARKLEAAGYRVVPVPATQAALLDGGLSCQSLRF